MSVLIKGMDMPKNCGKCFIGDRSLCANGCPLVEVPTPHGRLLDEKEVFCALFARMHALQKDEIFRIKHGDIDLVGVIPHINSIKPVVEAEE